MSSSKSWGTCEAEAQAAGGAVDASSALCAMMGVDGLGGNWLGGVAAKAGSDEIRMDNLGNSTIMVHSLV